MVKVLFCGDISTKDHWGKLVERLKELQQSSHGPFHILFLTGKIGNSPSQEVIQELSTIEIKIYSLNVPILSPEEVTEYNNVIETFPMKHKGIISIQSNLTVAFLRDPLLGEFGSQGRDNDEIISIISSVGYRGCDFLFTSSGNWPADAYQFLDGNELQLYQQLGLPMGGSREASDFAMTVRPRYHFSAAQSFFQRTPYLNNSKSQQASFLSLSSSTQQPNLFTRLITLSPVSESKEKDRKWLHALSLQPIIVMKTAELEESPNLFTECPYVPTGKRSFAESQLQVEDATPASKRFKQSNNFAGDASGIGADGTFFFGNKGHIGGVAVSGAGAGGKPLNLIPPHPDARTLFVGGLLPETNEQDLNKFMKNIRSIRRQPGKRFCFVEFENHAAANYIIEKSQSRPFKCDGRTLVVGWANTADPNNSNNNNNNNVQTGKAEEVRLQQMMSERQLIPPSDDALTLYFGNLPFLKTDEDLIEQLQSLLTDSVQITAVQRINQPAFHFAFVEFATFAEAMAVVTRSVNEKLYLQEKLLIIGWAKHAINSHGPVSQPYLVRTPPHPDCKVLYLGNLPSDMTYTQLQDTLVTQLMSLQLPHDTPVAILSVKKAQGRDYAFVDFDNVVSAQTALNIMSQGLVTVPQDTPAYHQSNTDSNTDADSNNNADIPTASGKTVVTAGWAKGRAADADNQSMDCWFCLASASVKVHLLISVGLHSYVALPRGGLSSHHVLICPIDCVPNRLHLSLEAKQEMLKYLRSWEKFFAQQGQILITFERCLRTKHSRDHMQIHCVPLSHEFLPNVQSVFSQKSNEYGYIFHDIPANMSVEDFVLAVEGGPYQEYFYVELPYEVLDEQGVGTGAVKRHRKVYLHDPVNVSNGKFIMSFGSELVAHMMEKPERAFWKNCLVSEEEETQIAETLRTEFAPFDPVNVE